VFLKPSVGWDGAWLGFLGSETSQTIAAFALAAIPGVLVLELIEFGRPPFRDRSGARAFASYLILSLVVWGSAVVFLGADRRLAAVIDAAHRSGQVRVDAYAALAWRLLIASLLVGVAARFLLWVVGLLAFRVEERRRAEEGRPYGWPGDVAIRLVAITYGWDRLMERLRRGAQPQIVHVRLRDGSDLFGVLAAGGSADFQSDGRGLVRDAELLAAGGELVQVPNSSGVFVSADAVASVAFVDYADPA
jgi:hypothetical protein